MRFIRSPYSIRNARVAALALALALPLHAEASQSGGTESPFAFGVGARALSLGGAYVASAEGPTAMTWNPAGLANVQSKQFSLFYTSPFVEGNRYSFVGYVHPFLDLGTVAFGNMRYGVSDIAKYDAGGAALGSFDNAQNEWIIGYALPAFGRARFGANIKMETHSLDGESATAVGADVGFLFQASQSSRSLWSTRNLAFGVMIRNALEPRLTLRTEEERLPTLMRSGVGYSIPMGGFLDRVLLLASFEQGKQSGGRSKFGAEVMTPSGLAFRGGAGPDEWATGIGFQLAGGQLDYAFGSQELGTSHRLELTMSFGSSLTNLRADRSSREEERLAIRTQEELERNARAQFEDNLERGKQHLAEKRYLEAESWFDRALLWEPENPEVNASLKQARIERHIAEGDRSLESGSLLEAIASYNAAIAVDSKHAPTIRRLARATDMLRTSTARSEEVNESLTRGIEFLALSQFSKARGSFNQVLQIDPENADAQRYLARSDSLITVKVDDLVDEGRWFRSRGDIASARARFNEANALQPSARIRNEIARLDAAQANRAGAEGAKAAERPKPRRNVSAEERAEAERMYGVGLGEFRQRRNSESIPYFEFVYGIIPDFENVESYLKQAYLSTGMELYSSGQLDEAIQTWEKILKIDPSDGQALEFVRRANVAKRKAGELSGGER